MVESTTLDFQNKCMYSMDWKNFLSLRETWQKKCSIIILRYYFMVERTTLDFQNKGKHSKPLGKFPFS